MLLGRVLLDDYASERISLGSEAVTRVDDTSEGDGSLRASWRIGDFVTDVHVGENRKRSRSEPVAREND